MLTLVLPLPDFDYKDALKLETQLQEDEKMARDMANKYCQQHLMPRILKANREEKFDATIMQEMGNLGLLGCTIDGYGCPGFNYVTYGLIAREVCLKPNSNFF